MNEKIPLKKDQHLILLRNKIKEFAAKSNLSNTNLTRLLTAASELGRNILEHGGGGHVVISEKLNSRRKKGIMLIFKDEGPGIPDLDSVMKDGYSTGKGMGLGLPGAKRLADEFNIETNQNGGTRVSITKW